MYGWHFKTGFRCTFDTGSDCTFNTGSHCTFNTGSDCTFNTGSDCTFDTGYECTFKTGYQCVVVRRDMYEVIELDGTKKIKLSQSGIKGYTIIENEIETIQVGDHKYDKKEIENALRNIKPIE